MDQSGKNTGLNNNVISSELLNKCISGRRGGRLTSILPSHILTRGGAKKHKFVPNIPVRQDKSKEENSQEKAVGEESKHGRHRRQDRGNNSRGRGRGKAEVVQLQGSVFGEGLSQQSIKKERVSRFSERSGNDSNAMEMPKYTPVSIGKFDEEDEKESLKELFKDDFLSDSDDSDINNFGPVKLPLTSTLNCKKENKSVCQSIKIKQEPTEDMGDVVVKKGPLGEFDEKVDYKCNMDLKEEKNTEKIKSTIKHEVESKKEPFSNIFTNKNIHDHRELLLFQFPDCLPKNCFVDDEDDDDIGKGTQETETKEDDNNECQKNYKWSLNEMPEGFIGKLQLLKSGKVQLKIGTHCFDVREGLQAAFLQQVVKLNEESGDLHVLGHVKNKVVCSPNLENLTNYNWV